jgi:hypothetical protein
MSSSSSSYDSSSDESQNDSEYNYVSDYVFETEQPQLANDELEEQVPGPYEDEPIADEEWLLQYNTELQEEEEEHNKLKQRLDGTEPVASW